MMKNGYVRSPPHSRGIPISVPDVPLGRVRFDQQNFQPQSNRIESQKGRWQFSKKPIRPSKPSAEGFGEGRPLLIGAMLMAVT